MSAPVVLLGSGNVAAALALALRPHRPVRVWARRPEAAVALAAATYASPSDHGVTAHVDLTEALAGEVHAVLFAVSDGALAALASQLAELPPGLLADTVCMHLSGYHGTGVLAPLALPACLHPNAAVTVGAGPGVFRGAHFGIGGEGEALERARDLALELGGKPLVVADEDRPRYHAAATLLASGTVGLFGKAEDLLTSVLGESQRDEARALLRGLLGTTAGNLQRGAAGDVLTGPIARWDRAVIRGHERALEHPQWKVTRDLYRVASIACEQLPRDRSAKDRGSEPDAEPEPALEQRVIVTLGPADVGWHGDHFEVEPAALAWRLGSTSVGAVELRLDLCLPSSQEAPGLTPERLVELLVEEVAALVAPLPLLAACHPVGSPGTAGGFQGSDDERLVLLGSAARSGVQYLDLDATLTELVIARIGSEHEVDLGEAAFVLSNHLALPTCEPLSDEAWRAKVTEARSGAAPDPTPTGERVDERLDRALFAGLAREAALDATPRFAHRVVGHKLVGVVERPEEALELLGWGFLRQRSHPHVKGRLAVFAGGSAGSFARVLAPRFGADFLYAAARSSSARVPGQLGVLDLLRSWPDGSFANAAKALVLGVLGHPVAGSLSPALFRRLGDETYLDNLVFAHFDFVEPDAALRFAARFEVCLSVTAPHKGAARRIAVNSTDRELRSIGAANTLVQEYLAVPDAPDREPGEANPLYGFNTDVAGVQAALEELFAGRGLSTTGGFLAHASAAPGKPVVVLGAGGAARAVLAAVRASVGGADLPLVVLARVPKKAMALAREFGAAFGGLGELAQLEPLVLVHTTTAGSHASPDPAADWVPGPAALDELARCVPGCRVLDANYRPSPTPLVAAARARGLVAADGRTWFLAQALAQFELFTGAPFGMDALQRAVGEPPRWSYSPEAGLALGREHFERVLAESEHPGGWTCSARARRVVLIGQRGTGKSSVSTLLQTHLGSGECWDIDHDLARCAGTPSAGTLLTELGERRFRVLEAAAIEERLCPSLWTWEPVGGLGPAVLALGGGAVETPRVRELLADCTVVWLRATPEELAARVAADPTPRPPIAAGGGAPDPLVEARAVASRRDPLYAEVADHEIVTSGLTPAEVADRIAELLGS